MAKSDESRPGVRQEPPIVERPVARPNQTLKLPEPTPPSTPSRFSELMPYLQPEDQALLTRLKSRLYGREEV